MIAYGLVNAHAGLREHLLCACGHGQLHARAGAHVRLRARSADEHRHAGGAACLDRPDGIGERPQIGHLDLNQVGRTGVQEAGDIRERVAPFVRDDRERDVAARERRSQLGRACSVLAAVRAVDR